MWYYLRLVLTTGHTNKFSPRHGFVTWIARFFTFFYRLGLMPSSRTKFDHGEWSSTLLLPAGPFVEFMERYNSGTNRLPDNANDVCYTCRPTVNLSMLPWRGSDCFSDKLIAIGGSEKNGALKAQVTVLWFKAEKRQFLGLERLVVHVWTTYSWGIYLIESIW